MKSAAFDYVRPTSLAEAVGILAGTDRDAQVMAGGQSLVAMMNLRVASPELIVDIERLDELRAVSDDGGTIWLGACVTHAAIEDALVPDPSRGLMPSVAANLAYRAVRTRGTIGGSLALSDPAADWLTVMAALDAQVVLRGPPGPRSVSATDFTTGIYETVRGRDEIIEGVRIRKLAAGAIHRLEAVLGRHAALLASVKFGTRQCLREGPPGRPGMMRGSWAGSARGIE